MKVVLNLQKSSPPTSYVNIKHVGNYEVHLIYNTLTAVAKLEITDGAVEKVYTQKFLYENYIHNTTELAYNSTNCVQFPIKSGILPVNSLSEAHLTAQELLSIVNDVNNDK
ncbi:hypothetical protein Hanom_Chr11g01024891 [Helianthus anomalus]